MTCPYCHEEVLLPSEAFPQLPYMQNVHKECVIRMLVQVPTEDPPGLTLREGARRAYEEWQAELKGKRAASLVPPVNEGAPGEPGHLISTDKKCPVDPAHEGYELRDYDEVWRDGKIHCAECGVYIRRYDAG